MHKAAKAYFQTQVATTSQGKLLLMLYDGCIKFLNQAKEKIAERDYAQKGILISRALDVINELDSSLNADKGGDLAANLHKLYFYCSTRLLSANLKMDTALIDEVIKILSGLRSAYAQIIDTPEAMAAAAMTAPVQAGQTHAPQQPTGIPKPSSFGGGIPKPTAFGGKVAAPGTAGPAQGSGADDAHAGTGNSPVYATHTATDTTAGAAKATPVPQGEAAHTAHTQQPLTPTAPQPAPTAAAPQADDTPLDFSGKRLAGAAMYRKMATHSMP